MPASEIDEIFASKGKAKAKTSLPSKAPAQSVSSHSSSSASSAKKKAKKRAGKAHTLQPLNDGAMKGKKRPAPETVDFVDPSSLPPETKRQKVSKSSAKKPDLQEFKDSRGTGPRKLNLYPSPTRRSLTIVTGRQTEEGWSVYKEDELGITNEGGGAYN